MREFQRKKKNSHLMARPITVGYRMLDGEVGLSKRKAREFLGIRHTKTFEQAIKALNIREPFNWDDLKRLFGLKTFLTLTRGNRKATREVYAILEENNHHLTFFQEHNFDLNQEFTRTKNDFITRQKWTQ